MNNAQYHLQFFALERWCDWEESYFEAEIRSIFRSYAKEYPTMKFRVIKRTITEEVLT